MKIGELVAMLRLDRSQFDSDVDGAESKFKSFGSRLASAGKAVGAAAGAGAGVALAAGLATSMEMGAARAKLSAQLGATGAESQKYGQLAGSLYSQAYGGSLDEVNQAIRSVVQNIGGMSAASDADLKSVTANVMSLSSAFDQDLGQTTRAVDQMIRNGLAPNAQAALDILARGFQTGADEAGDLLDTVNEYGTQFRKLGVDGAGAMGMISQGLQAGARDADTVADALKEFSIRSVDGSKATAEGFKAVGLDAQDMASKIAQGGPTASAALDMTLDRLRAMPDPVARSQAAVALFGTKAEDLGDALFAIDPSGAVAALGQVEGAAGQLDAALMDTAQNKIETAKRSVQMFGAELVNLPGPFGVAAAGAAAVGPAALSVLGPLGTMVAAQRAAAAASAAAGATQKASWLSTAATATASGIKTGAAWLLSAGASAASAIASTVASGARLVASWAVTAAGATANAVRTGAVWALATGTSAATAIASAVASGARLVAAWAVTAAGATMHALRTAGAWLLVAGSQAGTALATMAVTAAQMVARWAMMAAGAMARAAIMAAAWIVAMGPVGWVIAAVIGLVVLIIANWDRVKAFTIAAWNAVTAFISSAWSSIVSTVSSWIANAVSFIVNGWNRAKAMTVAAWSALVATIASWIARAIAFVQGIPGKVLAALSNLGSLLVGSGRALVDGFLNGIKGAWNKVVGWVKDGVAKVRALFPFSPAKTGPFSGRGYVTHSGAALTGDFAKSLRAGTPGIIASARDIVDKAQTEFAPKRLTVPTTVSSLPGDAWLSRAGQRATTASTPSVSVDAGFDSAALGDALEAAVHRALDGARMRVDGRGVTQLVNRQNASDRRLGGTRVPVQTGQGR